MNAEFGNENATSGIKTAICGTANSGKIPRLIRNPGRHRSGPYFKDNFTIIKNYNSKDLTKK